MNNFRNVKSIFCLICIFFGSILLLTTPSITAEIQNSSFLTFFGGSDEDTITGVATDNSGATYIVGHTGSSNFPIKNAYDSTINGQHDVFVAKLNLDGTLNYSTFLGGSNYDVGWSIAVDNDGYCYVTGDTFSVNFPTQNAFNDTHGGMYDGFVTKINPDGTLNYSTFLAGSDMDYCRDIAVNDQGLCYVLGHTSSVDYPLFNPINDSISIITDPFITILNPNGTLNFSTFIRGTTATAIELNIDGSCVVSGQSYHEDLLVTPNAFMKNISGPYDGFITKFTQDWNISYCSYLGGSSEDYIEDIAVDSVGNIFITGSTISSDFPTVNAYDDTYNSPHHISDIFVTKLDTNNQIVFSTYIGGINDDYCKGITVDSTGNCFLLGTTSSEKFPVKGRYDRKFNGMVDMVLMKFTSDGNLEFSTYLGGSGPDNGESICVDSNGYCYIAGTTISNDFPLLNGIYTTLSGSETADGLVGKLNLSNLGSIIPRTIPGFPIIGIILAISTAVVVVIRNKKRKK